MLGITIANDALLHKPWLCFSQCRSIDRPIVPTPQCRFSSDIWNLVFAFHSEPVSRRPRPQQPHDSFLTEVYLKARGFFWCDCKILRVYMYFLYILYLCTAAISGANFGGEGNSVFVYMCYSDLSFTTLTLCQLPALWSSMYHIYKQRLLELSAGYGKPDGHVIRRVASKRISVFVQIVDSEAIAPVPKKASRVFDPWSPQSITQSPFLLFFFVFVLCLCRLSVIQKFNTEISSRSTQSSWRWIKSLLRWSLSVFYLVKANEVRQILKTLLIQSLIVQIVL